MQSDFTQAKKKGVYKHALLTATALTGSLLLMAGAVPASAESLREALSTAYLHNPTLKAARAQLRATDEGVARARSGYRPTISASGDASFVNTDIKSVGKIDSYPQNYSVTLSQPIFRGFRTINAIRGADAAVEAGREDLRAAEHQVLLSAVTAYVNVVRDQALLNLQRNNLNVLREQLKATQDRKEVGQATKTDVAQAEASVAGAKSAVSAAHAQLQASRAVYAQVIGKMPSRLRDPGPARWAPRSLKNALRIGEGESPTILGAIFLERAQENVVKQTKGELLPEMALQASYTHSLETTAGYERQNTTTVTGKITVPLYQGGEVHARIRQGIETQAQLRHQIDAARQEVRANVISAWGTFSAARAQIISDNAQVDANRVALDGVKKQAEVGERTVLDVLNAEQALLDSKVKLATSRRNLAVASYSLLSAIGRISSADLYLNVEQYDPAKHYSEVAHKWIGWDTSTEGEEAGPDVAPVTAKGRTPDQSRKDGPAFEEGRW
ncbi:MAG: TolC family outer membrane protein [Alphaproteobacteria bacterium]